MDSSLFKVEGSKRKAVELKFFNGESWVSLTNKQTRDFLAKTMLRKNFGRIRRMERILSIERDVPELDITFAKKLQEQLPTNLEMEKISLQDLSTLAEQVHVGTREAATNTGPDMQEFLGIDNALRNFKSEIVINLAKLSEVDKQFNRD